MLRRRLAVAIVVAVVLAIVAPFLPAYPLTLVTQALPFQRFLTWLGVAGGHDDALADQCRAVLISARRAQSELDALLASGLMSRRDHAEQWAVVQRSIIDAELILRMAGHGSQSRVALPAVLSARKAALLESTLSLGFAVWWPVSTSCWRRPTAE